jgi:hypothetical protein
MIRTLLILAFMLSVAGNSLAAVAPVVEGDGGCGGCCSASRLNQPSVSPSKLCCLADCNQSGETQQPAPPSLLRTERDNKSISPVAVVLAAAHSVPPSGFLHSLAGSVVQSTHIYLKTGALLI